MSENFQFQRQHFWGCQTLALDERRFLLMSDSFFLSRLVFSPTTSTIPCLLRPPFFDFSSLFIPYLCIHVCPCLHLPRAYALSKTRNLATIQKEKVLVVPKERKNVRTNLGTVDVKDNNFPQRHRLDSNLTCQHHRKQVPLTQAPLKTKKRRCNCEDLGRNDCIERQSSKSMHIYWLQFF